MFKANFFYIEIQFACKVCWKNLFWNELQVWFFLSEHDSGNVLPKANPGMVAGLCIICHTIAHKMERWLRQLAMTK